MTTAHAKTDEAARSLSGLPDWVLDCTSDLPGLLLIPEAANALRMHPRTIRRMIRAGVLRAVRATESGSARVLIPRAEIQRYLASLAA
jgi:excisionase family DNA binding protein